MIALPSIVYRNEEDLKDEDVVDLWGRAARKVKPELIIKSELLRFLLLGVVSFVLETSFSKEVLARVSGSMAAARLDK